MYKLLTRRSASSHSSDADRNRDLAKQGHSMDYCSSQKSISITINYTDSQPPTMGENEKPASGNFLRLPQLSIEREDCIAKSQSDQKLSDPHPFRVTAQEVKLSNLRVGSESDSWTVDHLTIPSWLDRHESHSFDATTSKKAANNQSRITNSRRGVVTQQSSLKSDSNGNKRRSRGLLHRQKNTEGQGICRCNSGSSLPTNSSSSAPDQWQCSTTTVATSPKSQRNSENDPPISTSSNVGSRSKTNKLYHLLRIKKSNSAHITSDNSKSTCGNSMHHYQHEPDSGQSTNCSKESPNAPTSPIGRIQTRWKQTSAISNFSKSSDHALQGEVYLGDSSGQHRNFSSFRNLFSGPSTSDSSRNVSQSNSPNSPEHGGKGVFRRLHTSEKRKKFASVRIRKPNSADLDQNRGLVKIRPELLAEWESSFDALLHNPNGRALFHAFLKSEFSEENINFWLACEEYRTLAQSQLNERAKVIRETYLAPNSLQQVNLDSETQRLTSLSLTNPDPDSFRLAQSAVEVLMSKDSYQRFLRSPFYQQARSSKVSLHRSATLFERCSNINASAVAASADHATSSNRPSDLSNDDGHGKTTTQTSLTTNPARN